jgi:hypothetical protein
MPVDSTPPTERDQLHFLFLARLEADGSARRNVEAHPVTGCTVESEYVVHFEKMIVTSYLYGPIAFVAYQSTRGGSACVQLNFAVIENVLSGMHFSSY